MTVSSTNRKAGPFIGNNVTTAFPFAFRMFETDDLLVVRLDVATNVETALVIDLDFTATLNADQDNSPGGTVTLLSPLATGTTLVITSDVPPLQETVLTNQGGFYPNVLNAALDRLTILVQQNARDIARSFLMPLSAGASAPTIQNSPNGYLQWNADGTDILAVDLADIAATAALPPQAGAAGYFLTTNGSVASWAPVAVSAGQISGLGPLATFTGSGAAGQVLGWDGSGFTLTTIAQTPSALAVDIWQGTGGKNVQPDALEVAQAPQTKAYASAITLDGDQGITQDITLTGNAVLANPVNMPNGRSGVLWIVQDGTGGRTLSRATSGSTIRILGGTGTGNHTIPINTAANSVTAIGYAVRGGIMYLSATSGFV